jgi:hypothetical protein
MRGKRPILPACTSFAISPMVGSTLGLCMNTKDEPQTRIFGRQMTAFPRSAPKLSARSACPPTQTNPRLPRWNRVMFVELFLRRDALFVTKCIITHLNIFSLYVFTRVYIGLSFHHSPTCRIGLQIKLTAMSDPPKTPAETLTWPTKSHVYSSLRTKIHLASSKSSVWEDIP